MRRLIRVAVLATVFLVIPVSASAAEEVTVNEILEMGADLAGEEVALEGELVGDYGFRDDGSMWTQLNGDTYALLPIREGGRPAGANIGIALRIPLDLSGGLDPPGGYRYRGPIVRVIGIWKYHDTARPGESYVEVQSLTVTEPGRQLDQEIDWDVILFGLVLLIGAGIIALLTRPEG